MTTSGGSAGANDATVEAGTEIYVGDQAAQIAALEAEAEAADDAVVRIEEKMAGWQRSLQDARDTATTAHERLEKARG